MPKIKLLLLSLSLFISLYLPTESFAATAGDCNLDPNTSLDTTQTATYTVKFNDGGFPENYQFRIAAPDKVTNKDVSIKPGDTFISTIGPFSTPGSYSVSLVHGTSEVCVYSLSVTDLTNTPGAIIFKGVEPEHPTASDKISLVFKTGPNFNETSYLVRIDNQSGNFRLKKVSNSESRAEIGTLPDNTAYLARLYQKIDSGDNQIGSAINITVGDPSKAPGSSTGAALDCTKTNSCTKAGGEACPNDPNGIQTAIGCVHTDPQALIKDVFRLAIGIGGGIAFLLMVFGAFEMVTSAGNPDNLKNGQQRFINAIIGILFIVFSTLLLQIIGVDILHLEEFIK